MKLLTIKPSTRKGKKLMAEFGDGRVIHFGAAGYQDYTIHKDEKRKARYIARHQKNEAWDDPQTAGSLARYILWNKPTLDASIRDYKDRFNL